MSEEKKVNETEQKPEEKGGIKGFFKKVKDALEKIDKKLEEINDKDPFLKPEDALEKENSNKENSEK